VDLTDGTVASDPKLADATALDLIKQLITLSSGVLALSATFIEKFTTSRMYLMLLLAVAWLLLMVSIYAGLQAMSALVQASLHPEFTWVREHLVRYARISKYCFALGISCFALFAYTSFLVTIDDREHKGERGLLEPNAIGAKTSATAQSSQRRD